MTAVDEVPAGPQDSIYQSGPAGRPPKTDLEKSNSRWGLALVAPAVIYFGIFWLYPMVTASYYSLTEFDLLSAPEWLAFDNYTRFATASAARNSLGVTFWFALGTIIPTILLGLLIAMPLSREGIRSRVLRAMFFIPAVLPLVAATLVWEVIYQHDGLANRIASIFGVEPVGWLTDPNFALISLIVVVVWQRLGLYILIFIAGVQAIPPSLYEAAAIDGSRTIRTFLEITLPLLKRTILFLIIIATVGSMQSFVPAFILTRGGPNNATEVLPLYLFNNAFAFTRMGYASAIAVLMFIALVGFSVFQFRLFKDDE